MSPCTTIRKPIFDGYPPMLVGYMRVSSDSDRQSTDLQRDALLAAGVDARHLFEDRASGAKDDRAGLARALEFVRSGDVLVVWKLDRLGRSLSHLLGIVTSLKDNKVAFRSLTENLDTTTPSGEFLFQVFGALAQYERALIQERVVAGLAAATAMTVSATLRATLSRTDVTRSQAKEEIETMELSELSFAPVVTLVDPGRFGTEAKESPQV